MKKLFAMTFVALFTSTLLASSTTVNIFEGDKWNRRDIKKLAATMVINSDDEVGVQVRFTTPKRHIGGAKCTKKIANTKYCRVTSFTEYPAELSYDSESNLVFFGETVCGEVEEGLFKRNVVLNGDCQVSVTKTEGVYKVNLVK